MKKAVTEGQTRGFARSRGFAGSGVVGVIGSCGDMSTVALAVFDG
jgi:hypothetical protein